MGVGQDHRDGNMNGGQDRVSWYQDHKHKDHNQATGHERTIEKNAMQSGSCNGLYLCIRCS